MKKIILALTKLTLSISLIFCVIDSFGQILISTGGTVPVTNGQIFYDAGGAAGNDQNTSYTITLIPAISGESVCVDFTYFKTELSGMVGLAGADRLEIYDGLNISATNIGSLQGDYTVAYNASGTPYYTGQGAVGSIATELKPGIFCANNASGALTFRFVNNNSSQNPGWVGNIITYQKAIPGCNINLSATPNPVCSGSPTTLTAVGNVVTPSLSNDFNTSTVGTGWNGSLGTISFLNVLACQPNNGYSTINTDNSIYVWMQNIAAPRILETAAFDLTSGGSISFDFREASDDNGGNGCEALDNKEGIYVQYSTNNGTTWTTCKLMFPGELGGGVLGCGNYVYNWNTTSFPIPNAAKTASTKFRWIQPQSTSGSEDSWGIDNVKISANNPMTITITNQTTGGTLVGTSSISPYSIAVTPTATTTYRATITSGVTSCFQDLVVTVNNCGCIPPTINTQPIAQSVCSGSNTSFTVTASGTASGYQWQVNSGSGWTNISNGGVYSGATTSTLNITGATAAMSTYQYQCIISEATNACSTTSSAVAITVNTGTAPTYTTASTNVTCAGVNTGSITISPMSAGQTYTWVSGPIVSPIPAVNKPGGAIDERALINLPAGTYCVNISGPSSGTTTQTLFTEEWETGGLNWTINNAGGPNIFIINNDYIGGSCVTGLGTFTVPIVPNEPAAVPGNPTSKYLHIKATTTTGATCGAGSVNFIPLNANFDGVASSQTTTLNTPIVTTGLTNVVFNFYWLGKGDASGNDYGAIEYSTNGGTTWTQAGAKLFNKTTWFSDLRTDPSWSGQANLRFRIKWVNNASSSIDPPIAIDHIVITADLTTTCSSTVQECVTINPPAISITPTFASISPICNGATAPVLPTSSTNSPAITGTWSPAVSNTTTGTYTFTPTAGQCALSTTLNVTVTPNITPTFTAVSPICSGATLTALPTTSTNGITGTWSPALNNTSTTIYTFTPTTGQCATTTTLTITVNPNITPTFAAVGPYCNGSVIPALPTTSTNSITGIWSPAINNTNTTTYTFTPTAGQCATTTTLTIAINSSIIPTFTAVTPICSGTTLSLLPTTSNNSITGTWSPALNNTNTTTYTFTPNTGQCASTTTLTITVNPQTIPNFAIIPAFCSGSIAPILGTTSPNGITGTWSPAIINNTSTGTYIFTPTSGLCATTQSLTVTVNSLPIASAGLDQILTCATTSSSINGSASSSGINYAYTWATTGGNVVSGNTTSSPTINQAGTYNITVTNTTTGCNATDQMIVTSNTTLPTASAGTDLMLSCTISNINLNGSGSSSGANYTYLWSTIGGNIISGGNTTSPTIDQAGTYSIIVTNTTNGCTATDAVAVTNNSASPTAAGGADQTLTCTINSLILNGSLSSSGAGITYSWSTTGGNIVSGGSTTNPTINQAGTYTLSVTNTSNGCSTTDVVIVTSNTSPPIASAGADKILTCATTSVVIDGSGSSAGANYTYTWSTTGGNIVSGNTTSSPTVNQIGTYNLNVTNSINGCTSTDQMNVTNNTILPIASAGADEVITCAITSTTINGSGSSSGANITYNWSTIGGNIVSGHTTSSPLVNQAGTYIVTVTNNQNGCNTNDQMIVTSNTIIPVAAAGSDLIITCTSPSVSINGSGSSTGTDIIYAWSTISGNIVSGNSTASPVVNQAGNYSVIVTNTTTGCTSTDQMTVTSNSTLPIAAAGADQTLTCTTTTLTINGSQSSTGAIYTYLWATIGGNIVSGNTTSSPLVNQAGTYNITVTNLTNGCIATDQMLITSNTILPLASAGADLILTCTTTSATIDGSGSSTGTNYSYLWSTTSGNFVSGNTTSSPTINQVGIYNVTVTNNINGCFSTDQMTVSNNTSFPTSSIIPNNIQCHGELNGSANLTVIGGNPPFQYLWSNSASSEDLTGVGAGVYSVIVTDIYGCTTTNGTTIVEPAAFHISTNPSLSTCYNQPVNLNVSATGGTGPNYSFIWSNGSNGNNILVTPLTSTLYIVTATDQNGCSSTANVNVYVSLPINVTLVSNVDSVCPGEAVLLTPIITGGVGPPYTIINQDGNIVTPPIYVYPQASGSYSVSVQDACGTQDQGNVFIKVLPLPQAGFLSDIISGCEPLTVHFNEIYPIDGRTFVWNFGDNENLSLSHNPVHTYTSSGVFTVSLTVTSIWGCKTTLQNTNMITVYPKPNAQFTWTPEFATVIKPIIEFNNHTSGANSYMWTFGDGDSTNQVNPEHRFSGAGSWPVQLIAISNMGCRDTVIYPIEIEEENTLYAPTAFSPDNDNVNDNFFVTGTGIDKDNFLLNIYDRWGEIIFTSTDIERSWNGCAKNTMNPVPVGTYTWLVIYRDSRGIKREKSGPVTVIR